MTTTFNSTLTAHAVGFGSGAWLAGSIASISLLSIPALRASKAEDGVDSSTLAKQWTRIFNIGKSVAPPFAAISAASYAYLAWTSRHFQSRNTMLLYSGSAILTVGIVPFTLIFMNSTNNKLLKHTAYLKSGPGVSAADKLDDTEIDSLLAKWSSLNLTRSILPLVGCLMAFIAL